MAALGKVFSSRGAWDRFWALAARAWDTASLVALLSDDDRVAWFRFWEPKAKEPTPREQAAAGVGRAVGRLVAGDAEAAADPLIVKLRGPRTVADVLGSDPAWVFAEFGAREPEALWGARPGEAWWALEALARLRAGETGASLLPVEFPERGRETERALLGAGLAEREGDPGLALTILDGRGAADRVTFETSLRLLAKTGRADEAAARLAGEVRRQQPSLEEAGLRALEALAEDLKLASPLESLDSEKPLRPALLAYLHDRRGPAAARFQTADESGFRAALAARFAERGEALDAAQIRYWVFELWVRGASALPQRGLRKMGGLWAHAGSWLEPQAVSDRPEALAALDALPDTARLDAFVRARGQERQESVRLLGLRAALGRGDEAVARTLFENVLVELRGEAPLQYAPLAVPESGESDAELADEGTAWEEEEEREPEGDAMVARLETWLQPFREAGRADLAESRAAELLRSKRAEGPATVAAWSLAFRLAPHDGARAALDRELVHAWLRGDFAPENLSPVVEALTRFAPALAPRWLARWPETTAFSDAAARARFLERLRDRAGAARVFVSARARRGFSAADDLRAFDQWRRLGLEPTPASPAAWSAALPLWRRPAGAIAPALGDHLRAHPTDLLAARAALRALAPADEATMRRVGLALAAPTMEGLGSAASDERVVRLRMARGLLAQSPRAAQRALGETPAAELAQDLDRRRFPRQDVDTALADVARLLGRAGDARGAQAALAALADRMAPGLVELRADLALFRAPAPPRAFRLADGQPAPWRPRDLTFRLVADVLAAEGTR